MKSYLSIFVVGFSFIYSATAYAQDDPLVSQALGRCPPANVDRLCFFDTQLISADPIILTLVLCDDPQFPMEFSCGGQLPPSCNSFCASAVAFIQASLDHTAFVEDMVSVIGDPGTSILKYCLGSSCQCCDAERGVDVIDVVLENSIPGMFTVNCPPIYTCSALSYYV